MLQTLLLSPTLDLKSLDSSGELVAFNVDANGLLYFVFALNKLDYRFDKGLGNFAKSIPEKSQSYRVMIVGNQGVLRDIFIPSEVFNIHDVQPLRNNEILLVCGRSSYRGEGDFDRNGRIYSSDGAFVREILLGDGIQTVQATNSGEIWTSYFDEGIFGNFGWEHPVGAAGLIAWDASGNRLYEFEPDQSLQPMADCYALNVASNDETWCYYYDTFPLVRIHRHRIDGFWQVPVGGSGAFAVSDTLALFRGGYNRCDTFHFVELNTDGTSKELSQFQVRDENGLSFKDARVVGRARSIHFLKGAGLYRLDMEMAL